AHEAAPVIDHEVDGLRRDHLRGEREIALVLAVLVVAQDDHAAGVQLGQDIVDRNEDLVAVGFRHFDRRSCWTGKPSARRTLLTRFTRSCGDTVPSSVTMPFTSDSGAHSKTGLRTAMPGGGSAQTSDGGCALGRS